MKKLFLILLLAIVGLTSCSHSKTMVLNGQMQTIEPYGLATQSEKNDSVIYEANGEDVIVGIIFSETLVAPVWIFGWDVMEPVKPKYSK